MRSLKLFLLSLLCVSTLFYSCSDDDDDNTQPLAQSIVGKWKLQSFDTGDSEMNRSIKTIVENLGYNTDNMSIEFTSDMKTNVIVDGKTNMSGTYSISGDKVTIDYADADPFTATVGVNSNNMDASVTLDRFKDITFNMSLTVSMKLTKQ